MRKYGLTLAVLLVPFVAIAQPSELDCLTTNVFFEARGESKRGMQAVADVTLNRVKHSAFKAQDTVCKVVFAPYQFSWVSQQPKKRIQKLLNRDLSDLKDKDLAAYQKAQEVAVKVLNEGYKPLLPSWVISFHSVGITPQWVNSMRKYSTIGGHVFYGFKRKGMK
jgi:spore germination cell wall hydrolase CwlJ-like protein